ncbi:hypothetical protein NHG95_22410 [Pseudomonas corrugata]|nr:hypothetical protein [Pseudomonas corrugata]MDU9035896.1 hypothetical protein [Pseudomonas corrugata]
MNVGAGPRTDTGADGKISTRITVNQQLSPDLAQQQVNPVTLPGFDLLTGQNGLFRLNEGTGTPTQGSGLNQVRGLPDRSFQANPQKVPDRNQPGADRHAPVHELGLPAVQPRLRPGRRRQPSAPTSSIAPLVSRPPTTSPSAPGATSTTLAVC